MFLFTFGCIDPAHSNAMAADCRIIFCIARPPRKLYKYYEYSSKNAMQMHRPNSFSTLRLVRRLTTSTGSSPPFRRSRRPKTLKSTGPCIAYTDMSLQLSALPLSLHLLLIPRRLWTQASFYARMWPQEDLTYRKSTLWCSTIHRPIRRVSVTELEEQRGWAAEEEHGFYWWETNGSI